MGARGKVSFPKSWWFRLVLSVISGLLFLPWPAAAAAAEQPSFELLGPGGAGGIFTPACSPVDPNFMLCSCDMTGCYRSDDGGQSWRLIHYLQINSAIGCKPYFHPTDVNIVVWKDRISTDKAWTFKPLAKENPPWKSSAAVTQVACTGDKAQHVFIGTNAGIWASADAGGTWKQIAANPCGGIAILPDETVYAASGGVLYRWSAGKADPAQVETPNAHGPIKALAAGGNADSQTIHFLAQDGIHTSNDSGKSWRLAQANAKLTDVVMAVNQAQVAYSWDHADVFATKDGGTTWTPAVHLGVAFKNNNIDITWIQSQMHWDYGAVHNGLGVCASKAERVFFSTQAELFISDDAGGKWRQTFTKREPDLPGIPGCRQKSIGLEVTASWDYFFDPNDPDRHYAGFSDIGLARSLDKGATWYWATKGCPWGNCFYQLAFDPFQKGKIYAASTNKHEIIHWVCCDSRMLPGGICISEDYAATWTPAKGLPSLPCCGVAVDKVNSKPGAVVLYTTMYGDGVYKSVDSGNTWQKKPGVGRPGNYHVFQIRIHPKTNDLYVNVTANREKSTFPVPGGLWKSSDGGESWTELTAGLNIAWLNGFAVNPENPDIIHITGATTPAQKQGGVYTTLNGGAKWEHVLTDADCCKDSEEKYMHGLCLEPDPEKPNTVYFGSTQGLWVSDDNGKNWRRMDEVPFCVCHRVRFDPLDRTTMYVTNDGCGVIRVKNVKR